MYLETRSIQLEDSYAIRDWTGLAAKSCIVNVTQDRSTLQQSLLVKCKSEIVIPTLASSLPATNA